MFDWFFHLLKLKSPREMRQLEAQFRQDSRLVYVDLARAMALTLPPEMRAKTMAAIAEAERKEAGNND